jgi:AraC-like DNA-binding protein
MGDLVDRAVPADRCFNAHWRSWCDAVRAACDDTARIHRVEAFLHASLAEPTVAARMPTAAHLVLQAKSLGGSARSIARRLRAWLGLSPRDTRTLERLERTLVEAREQDADGTSAWAEMAAMGGYSDQAHLCRQARRGTGMSPGELARRANQDEACWLYRVWAQADAPSRPD